MSRWFKENRRHLIYFALIMFLILSGCASAAITPVPIDEEVDQCAECKMTVQDNQFAAEYFDEVGQVYKFDDIGCLARYVSEKGITKGSFFVRDFSTKEWIMVNDAYFAMSDAIETPMSYGFLAFRQRDGRDQFLKDHQGQGITWEEIKQKAMEKKNGMHMGEMK